MPKRFALIAVFALVGLLAAPVAVLAATGETEVTGTVASVYTLTVPPGIALPALNPGTTVQSTAVALSINTNVAGKTVTLSVRDKEQVSHIGKMYSAAITTALANSLKVKGGLAADGSEIAADFVALPAAASTVKNIAVNKALTVGTTYSISDFACQQVVAAGDLAGNYALTLLFEATFN